MARDVEVYHVMYNITIITIYNIDSVYLSYINLFYGSWEG